MQSEWPVQTFDHLIEQGALEIGDGYRAKNNELGGTGLIFLRAGHVKDTHIDFSGAERFLHDGDRKFGAKVARPGDVVVTTKGNSTGRIAFVGGNMPPFVYSPHLSYWRSKSASVIQQGFLRAWSRGAELAVQLHSMSRSTDMAPYLSLADQRRLRITLPPIHIQAFIAELSDSMEARIGLLRQTNATLEAIAQALFKSWFINFDPVRAKVEGREPEGMDAATAALFPANFVESAVGLVPMGWQVECIGDLVTVVGGSTPNTKDEALWHPATHHWTSPKDLSGATAPVVLDTERKISEAGLARISSGLLPTGTLLMSSRAPIGYLAVARVPLAINQGYIAMLPGGRLPPLYLYFWCQTNMDRIKGHANGSTFIEISKRAFRPIPALVPAAPVVQAFDELASALFERITMNEQLARSLTSMRDTLLPRLISGQLRLPDAQAQIEESLA